MSQSIALLIRQATPMPTWLEGVRHFLLSCGLGCTVALAQGFMWWVIEWRFSPSSISFPFALNGVERAGDWDNLVGWGYLVNDSYTISSVSRCIYEMVFIAAVGVTTCRVLGWGLLLSFAGAVANFLELGSRGAVLDWIILPNSGDGVRGLSLGDIAIYAGVGWTALMLVRLCAQGFREGISEFRKGRRESG